MFCCDCSRGEPLEPELAIHQDRASTIESSLIMEVFKALANETAEGVMMDCRGFIHVMSVVEGPNGGIGNLTWRKVFCSLASDGENAVNFYCFKNYIVSDQVSTITKISQRMITARLQENLTNLQEIGRQHREQADSLVKSAQDAARQNKGNNVSNPSAPWKEGQPSNATDRQLQQNERRQQEIRKVFNTFSLSPDSSAIVASQIEQLFEVLPHKNQKMNDLMNDPQSELTFDQFVQMYASPLRTMSDADWDTTIIEVKKASLQVHHATTTPRDNNRNAWEPRGALSSLNASPQLKDRQIAGRLVQLRTLFRFFDVDNSETIDKKDLQTMRNQITMADGTSWKEGELLSQMITNIDGKPVTFDDMDEDGDGKITVDEFIKFYTTPLNNATEDQWNGVFDKFKKAALATRRATARSSRQPQGNSPVNETR